MPHRLEVLFTPAEFAALDQRDLGQTACIVFDVLRATSSMMTALANGAVGIIPVAQIEEALALRRQQPGILLAGERDGWRIGAEQAGGVAFDLGNSPREFTREVVQGKAIAMTTTNGTRALKACSQARVTFIGTFLGLGALALWIEKEKPQDLLLVCAGTFEQASFEDALGAGALCDAIWPIYEEGAVADSATMVRQLYRQAAEDLPGAMRHARNARRLLSRAELREDVPWCLQRDTLQFLARMTPEGRVERVLVGYGHPVC
jgi:2-phosphosulfolactate phosphatase